MKKLLSFLCLCVAFGSSAYAQSKPVVIKYAHVGMANESQTRYASELADLVKEKTQGEVTLQIFPNSQLGGVAEMVDGVKMGAIGMGHHDFASLGKFLPDMSVFNAPYIYRDGQHAVLATSPKTSPVLRELNEKLVKTANMRVLGTFYRGARQMSTNFPVYSPADLKGKKIRGVPLQLWQTMIQGMGAIPTPVEITELYTALMSGMVSGQENPLTNIFALKFYEVQTHVIMTGHMQSVLSTFINEKVWNSLSEKNRALIDEAMVEMANRSLQWAVGDEKEARAKIEEKGVKFIDESNGLNNKAFREAVNAKMLQDFPGWKDYIARIEQIK